MVTGLFRAYRPGDRIKLFYFPPSGLLRQPPLNKL